MQKGNTTMNTLNNLNNAILQFQQNALAIGVTLAGLMIAVYAMIIMFKNDNSPQARTQRWDDLHRVLICAGVITGAGALVQFAVGFGKML
jgi:cytochrome bd-type quinol oxidase subunit 1